MPTKFGINFGSLCDPIAIQLKKQGVKFDRKEVMHFQQDAEAINRMKVRGYLTFTQSDKVINKLFREIEKHIHKLNKPTHA